MCFIDTRQQTRFRKRKSTYYLTSLDKNATERRDPVREHHLRSAGNASVHDSCYVSTTYVDRIWA